MNSKVETGIPVEINRESLKGALKRKVELLSVLFGLPESDVTSASIETMPVEFNLPKEMVGVYREIMAKEDSNKVEYAVVGDIQKGKLFFGKISRGSEDKVGPALKDNFLSQIGWRRIMIHSHGEVDDVRMSPWDVASFLLISTVEVAAVVAIKENFSQELRVLLGIRGKENLDKERERYLAGKYWLLSPSRQLYAYLSRKLEEIGLYRPLNEVAAIFKHNGCSLYVGTGHINTGDLRVIKVNPFDFTKFEEDPETKLILPKLPISS